MVSCVRNWLKTFLADRASTRRGSNHINNNVGRGEWTWLCIWEDKHFDKSEHLRFRVSGRIFWLLGEISAKVRKLHYWGQQKVPTCCACVCRRKHQAMIFLPLVTCYALSQGKERQKGRKCRVWHFEINYVPLLGCRSFVYWKHLL